MFLKRLYIKHYRCFGDEPVCIDFSESGLTALIGPNNVGKSTILKALEILLGDKWPTSQFNEDDFFQNDFSKDILIAGEFAHTISVQVNDTTRADVIGAVVRVKHLSTGYGESSMDVEYRLLGTPPDIEAFEFNEMELVGYGGRSDRPVYVSQIVRNQLPIVLTIPLIKLYSEQPTNKWGVLGKMLQKVEVLFAADATKKDEFEEKMGEAVGILRSPDEFKKIEDDIRGFWEEMKPNNLSGTDLTFLDYEPWRYYRQFKLAIKRHGKAVPVDTLGEGVQRLAIIALYRSYLRRHGRNQRAILLIEEPESYLHPQARKSLFRVLKEAIKEDSQAEGQIIYTTHSEDFIDCGDFNDIVVFSEKSGNVEARRLDAETLKSHTLALGFISEPVSDQHVFFRLVETISVGLKEALFAPRAVIVEGPSELELLRFMTDADKEQTAIVVAGGKGNIPPIYALLTAFGVPCLVMTDRDEERGGENKNIISMLGQINAADPDSTKMDVDLADITAIPNGKIFTQGRLLIFGKDLETVLQAKIPDHVGINTKLKEVFKTGDSKPKLIHALGLAHGGNCGSDADLEGKMATAKTSIEEISAFLKEYSNQEVDKPQILNRVV